MSELQYAVAELAEKTPDQIYHMLKRRKITGRPGTTGDCPLARLMMGSHTGRFIVGRKFIARQSGRVIEKVATPPSLAAFLRKFDLSQYSDLLAPPPRCLTKARPREKPWRSGPKKTRGKNTNHTARDAGR